MRNSSRDWSYATTFQGMPAFTSSEERGRERISPSLGKEEIKKAQLCHILISLHNCERTHFCQFKPPVSQKFVNAAPGNQYGWKHSLYVPGIAKPVWLQPRGQRQRGNQGGYSQLALVKHLPANVGDVRFGFHLWARKIPPEEAVATHSNILA